MYHRRTNETESLAEEADAADSSWRQRCEPLATARGVARGKQMALSTLLFICHCRCHGGRNASSATSSLKSRAGAGCAAVCGSQTRQPESAARKLAGPRSRACDVPSTAPFLPTGTTREAEIKVSGSHPLRRARQQQRQRACSGGRGRGPLGPAAHIGGSCSVALPVGSAVVGPASAAHVLVPDCRFLFLSSHTWARKQW